MRLYLLSIGSLLGLALLAGVASADIRISRSNDPTANIDGSLSVVPGMGREAFAPVSPMLSGPAYGLPDPAGPALPVLRYTDDFITVLPLADGDEEWSCLAEAIYFEARGESVKGQFAVAEVILNRRDSPLYPSTVCRVVHQRGGGGCQFSFTCDGLSDRIREREAFRTAGKIARLMLDGAPRVLTDGATHFHTRNVRPGWARKMPQTAEIGHHKFYRLASN